MLAAAAFLLGGPSACGGDGSDGNTVETGTPSASASSGPTSGASSSPSSSASAPSSNQTLSGELCANEERGGSLRMYLSGDRTIFDGFVADGVKPAGINREIAADGACRLYGPADLFCSTPCTSGTTCAGDDVCVPTPVEQSAGTISVAGLLAPVEMTPNAITGKYGKTILNPYPAFEPGAPIEVSASGDVISAFKLHGWGVPPLVTSLTTVNVSSGSGVPLTWDTAGVNPDHTEVEIWFSVDVHGSTTRWIECTVPDSGSFELPASLVTELIELGLSGFPRMTMTRRSADSVELSTGDCVDFQVGSEVKIELTVDGLISCNGDTECPDGQSCVELACE
jgi:hypothetical protein